MVYMSDVDVVLAKRCMSNDGYATDYHDSWMNFCKGAGMLELPVCQLDAHIPHRDRNKRMKSLLCQKYPKSELCSE